MRRRRESVRRDWTGPVAAVHDLPSSVLHGVALQARVDGLLPWESVRVAFKDQLGAEPQVRRTWRGTQLTWHGGKVPVTVRARGGRVSVRARNRVTPPRLRRLVAALGVLRAHDLRLEGEVERFVASPEVAGLE